MVKILGWYPEGRGIVGEIVERCERGDKCYVCFWDGSVDSWDSFKGLGANRETRERFCADVVYVCW